MSAFRKKSISDVVPNTDLKKTLGLFDLIMLGIGAIIGVGAFVLTGVAASKYAGPAIVLSYALSGIICIFVGLLYVELASMMPNAGSSYSYTYVALGEIFAWIVFWFMMVEYVSGSSMIAVGFSGYFNGLLKSIGVHIPEFLSETGVFNLPAFIIVWIVSLMLILGTKESSMLNIILVCIKVAAVIVFIVMAVPHYNFNNWNNFMPYGVNGVISGAGSLILAYVGFDALASTAEECKNPKRDLPIALFASLIICGLIYIGIASSLTLIADYKLLDNTEPMSFALRINGSNIGSNLVAIGAISGTVTSLVVQIYGQSRMLYSASRDGFAHSKARKIHSKFGTPHIGTLSIATVVSIFAALAPIDFIGQIANIGTLVSFLAVTISVMILRRRHPEIVRPFKCPKVWVIGPLAFIVSLYLLVDIVKHVVFVFTALVAVFVIYYYFGMYKKRK